jgi:hypothetical protein
MAKAFRSATSKGAKAVSRLTDDDLLPDDIDPVDHGRFNRASDEWLDAHPDRETEADRAEWERIKAEFMKHWEHLFFSEGCLQRRQAK